MQSAARARRAAKLAASLPSVVGEAACPCVRESIAREAWRSREPGEVRRDRRDRGQQDALARLGQHQRIGEVVDVLGRAGEMHELELGGRGAGGRELLAHVSTRPP